MHHSGLILTHFFYARTFSRYYYDGDMISKVQGKRFVYKFVCDLRTLIGYSAAELNSLVSECEQKKVTRLHVHGLAQPITTVTLATTTLDKDSWRRPRSCSVPRWPEVQTDPWSVWTVWCKLNWGRMKFLAFFNSTEQQRGERTSLRLDCRYHDWTLEWDWKPSSELVFCSSRSFPL